MKRFLSLVLALLLLAGVTACTDGDSSTDPGSASLPGSSSGTGSGSLTSSSSGGSSSDPSGSESSSGSGAGSSSDPGSSSYEPVESSSQRSNEPIEGPVVIGVFAPMTGDDAPAGLQEYLGIQYANQVTPFLEVSGRSHRIQLYPVDSGSSVETAVEAAELLLEQDVSVVLGTWNEEIAEAVGPLFSEKEIAVLGGASPAPPHTEESRCFLSLGLSSTLQCRLLYSFVQESLDSKICYCIGELGSESDQELLDLFQESYEDGGGKVVRRNFPTRNRDFTPYLKEAAKAGADLIFMPVDAEYGLTIVEQAGEAGMKVSLLGTDSLDSREVLEAVQGTDLNLYISSAYQEGSSPEFDAGFTPFITSSSLTLEDNGGTSEIHAVSALGYDAYNAAVKAVETARTQDPATVRAVLRTLSMEGVTGPLAFDPRDGNAERSTACILKADTEEGVWTLEAVQNISSEDS